MHARTSPASPLVHVLGIGCRQAADAAALAALVERLLARHSIAPAAIAAVATIDRRQHHPAIVALCRRLCCCCHGYPCDDLARMNDRLLSPSPVLQRRLGTAGVAESAALLVAGARDDPAVTLLGPRLKTAEATAALACGRISGPAVKRCNP